MSAGEFAFLAFGLVLGVAAGAALIEILRSRPRAPREVRLTVAQDSVPRRSSTLASPTPVGSIGPAPYGPADRRDVDRPEDPRTSVRSAAPSPVDAVAPRVDGPPSPPAAGPPPAASPRGPGPSAPVAVPPLVGIAIEPEPDQLLVALRSRQAEPPGVAVAAGVRATAAVGGASVAGAVLAAGTGASSPPDVGIAPSDIATAGIALRGGRLEAAGGGEAPEAEAGGGEAPEAEAGGGEAPEAEAGVGNAAGAPGAAGVVPEAGPCDGLRRIAEERCAVADGLAAQAEAAAVALRERQRESDEHDTRATAAADSSDPRALRTAKEVAQHEFRVASAAAASPADVEAAARTWLNEINRINRLAREAALTVRREREAVAALVPVLERLSIEADAARINAEAARESCLAARETLAECEEAARRPPVIAAATFAPAGEPEATGGANPAAAGEVPVAPAGTGPLRTGTADEAWEIGSGSETGAAAALGGHEPILYRLLAGDTAVADDLAGRLAGDEPGARDGWRRQLEELVDAVETRAIEAASLDFPVDHAFWGPFTREQCREISTALASLGFRFDGRDGFVDGRIPTQRDLSLAVGFAGLDPMRIRRWPSEAEMIDLYADVRVASDEYIAATAPGLTLGEMVALLGRRADGLTELWNAWGRVRPLLLAPA